MITNPALRGELAPWLKTLEAVDEINAFVVEAARSFREYGNTRSPLRSMGALPGVTLSSRARVAPKPERVPRPTVWAGGESEAGKDFIARTCDGWLTHGDAPDVLAPKFAGMAVRGAGDAAGMILAALESEFRATT